MPAEKIFHICSLICAGSYLMFSSTLYAWGPLKHRALAGSYYSDPAIADFAVEFYTDVSTVVNGAGELDFAPEEEHGKYHGGQWKMVADREYVYRPANPSDWFDIGETKRLKYMVHNLGDVSVPIGHAPANSHPGAPSGTSKEDYFELQADLNSYGNPMAPISWYTGRVSDCVSQFYDECYTNADYFANNVSVGFFTVTPLANATAAAQEAWKISQKLARVILTDYYLAKRPAADAGEDLTVGPGQSVTFSAVDLRDPDNIVWDADGSGNYHYDENWTGIIQASWDLDNDGIYETTGLEVTKTYAEIAAMIQPNSSIDFGIEVLDDEGNLTYDTASLNITPEPASPPVFPAGALLLLLGTK